MPLGPAAPIYQAIDLAHAASAANTADALSLWAKVSALVLNPLLPRLQGVTDLFLSPDGELHRVPYAVLPTSGSSGRLLYETFRLRLLTTGRDLIRLQQPASIGSVPVLIANPDYNAIGHSSSAIRAVTSASTGGGNSPIPDNDALSSSVTSPYARQQRTNDLIPFKQCLPLHETAHEAKALAPLLGVSKPTTGPAATAALVMRQQGPRILHIATHGFF